VSDEQQHALYPERDSETVTVRGQSVPGFFSGRAAIWTGGSSPRIIGPFDSAREAMEYQMDKAPGSQIFPFSEPGEL
jgi:hypothetical protein